MPENMKRADWWVLGASILTFLGVSGLVYAAFFAQVDPMESQTLKRVEMASSQNGGLYLLITSEFCMRYENEADVTRIFRRMPDDDDGLEEVIEIPPIRVHFLKGCHTRSRAIDLPNGIRNGRYQYQYSVRWCNRLNNCEMEFLPAATIIMDIRPEQHTLVIEDPHVP